MSEKIEKPKQLNFSEKFKFYSETINLNGKIVKRKSLIRRQTKNCAATFETHKNPETNITIKSVERKFDRFTGNMTKQTFKDYFGPLTTVTTEKWSPRNGAEKPLSITKENIFEISPTT